MAGEPHFEVYPQTRDGVDAESQQPASVWTGEFGWRFQAANGQITAVGGEGFTRRDDAHEAVHEFAYTLFRTLLGQRVGLDLGALPIIDVDDGLDFDK